MRFVTVADDPSLGPAIWNMPNDWPPFMQKDPVGGVFFSRLTEVFPQWQLAVLDGDDLVGKVNAVPFVWDGTDEDLPDRGWDAVQERAFADERLGRTPTAVSLLEARIVSGRRAAGLSRQLLEGMAELARSRGLLDLFGPVRPTAKHLEPHRPIDDYARAVRDDGLPIDPWLRVHVRMGARLVKICPAAMVVPGTLASWREWTDLPFDASGDVVVPFALNPVHVDVAQDHAVYVEPNVWMHHDLRRGG